MHICPNRSETEIRSASSLLKQYPDVFKDLPGKTHFIEHTMKLTTNSPIRSKPYPVPLAVQYTIRKEVEMMLRLDIIE